MVAHMSIRQRTYMLYGLVIKTVDVARGMHGSNQNATYEDTPQWRHNQVFGFFSCHSHPQML